MFKSGQQNGHLAPIRCWAMLMGEHECITVHIPISKWFDARKQQPSKCINRCRALHRMCLKESGQRSPAEWVFPFQFPSFFTPVGWVPALFGLDVCVFSGLWHNYITQSRNWQESVNTVADVVVLMNASDDVSAYSLSSDWLNDPSRCDTQHVFALLGGLVK